MDTNNHKLRTLKVFISLPMNGLSDDEIKINIEKAKNELIKKYEGQYELYFINSYISTDLQYFVKHPGAFYLGKSIEMMADADLVYFCKGWDHARGCKLEHDIAYAYNIKCIEEW